MLQEAARAGISPEQTSQLPGSKPVNRILRYLITTIIVVADQITKIVVDGSLALGERIPVLPWFNITLWYNEGSAFSFLSEAGGWQRWFFTIVSLVVSIVLIVWLYRLSRQEKVLTWALALILGGAIGNLIDRVIYGHVVDFIQWFYNDWYFPTFNIADAAITVGGVLFFITTFMAPEESHSEKTT